MNITQNQKKNLHFTLFIYQHENHKENSGDFSSLIAKQKLPQKSFHTLTEEKSEGIKPTNNSMMLRRN